MSTQELVFLLLAIATGSAALATVTSKNLVHAALFLATTLAGIGGVFLVLAADFIALVQIVVYVGAIAVLFLFGLMLTRAPIGREALDSQNKGLGAAVAASLFGVLVTLVFQAFSDAHVQVADVVTGPQTVDIGVAIFSSWILPFEVLSMLLLAALVGAIMLSRREDADDDTADDDVFRVTPIDVGQPPAGERELDRGRRILQGEPSDTSGGRA